MNELFESSYLSAMSEMNNKLREENNQLQSNWNSLRKELYQANRELVTNELVNGKELINNIIDIMNELERGEKNE